MSSGSNPAARSFSELARVERAGIDVVAVIVRACWAGGRGASGSGHQPAHQDTNGNDRSKLASHPDTPKV